MSSGIDSELNVKDDKDATLFLERRFVRGDRYREIFVQNSDFVHFYKFL